MSVLNWTTPTVVQQCLKGNGGSLSTAEIDEFISQAEGHIATILDLKSSDFTFSLGNPFHYSLRGVVTQLAACLCIASVTMSYITLSHAQTSTDMFWELYNEYRKFAADGPAHRSRIVR